jgi:hypothetical protein
VPRLRAAELTLRLPPVVQTGKLFCDNDYPSRLFLRLAVYALPALTSMKEHLRQLRRDQLLTDSGADRDRTDDLRLAKPALSQLSYSPEIFQEGGLKDPPSWTRFGLGSPTDWFGLGCPNLINDVGQGRLELPTSRLSGVRSNHLSYWPGWQGSKRHASDDVRSPSQETAAAFRLRATNFWVSLSETMLGP